MKKILSAALILLLTACFNRPSPRAQQLPLAAFGAKPGQATVLVFSALWCHPCREEIPALNQAQSEFAGQIQFLGFVVEGEQKGSTIEDSDVERFTSFAGEKPTYQLKADKNWQLFDKSQPPAGRSLPTMVIIDRQGNTQAVVQKTMDYQTQLRPILLALAQGQEPPPVERPVPPPVEAGWQELTSSMADWAARAEVVAKPDILANVTKSWERGLEENGFQKSDMPFETGTMTFSFNGSDKSEPRTAKWFEETPQSICTLDIVFNADGTWKSGSGICQRK